MTTTFEPGGKGRFSLVNGPSKFDLMAALFVGSSGSNGHSPVTFTTEDEQEIEVYINKVGREDGSGESWIFEGFISKVNKVPVKFAPGDSNNVTGWFRTSNRRGWFEYETS
jgi:hypothetical protein